MREDRLILNFEKFEHDIQSIQYLTRLTKTRIDAIERLLFKSRWGLLKLALVQLFSPATVGRLLNEIHLDELRDFEEIRKKVMKQKATGLLVPK